MHLGPVPNTPRCISVKQHLDLDGDRAMTTKVIVLASTKGGSGKSSIASGLAVCAADEGSVTLVDADPQQSAGFWWDRRGKPDNPHLATVHNERELARTIGRL